MLHKLPLVKSRGTSVLLCTTGACYLRSNLRCGGDSSVSPPDGGGDPGGKLRIWTQRFQARVYLYVRIQQQSHMHSIVTQKATQQFLAPPKSGQQLQHQQQSYLEGFGPNTPYLDILTSVNNKGTITVQQEHCSRGRYDMMLINMKGISLC